MVLKSNKINITVFHVNGNKQYTPLQQYDTSAQAKWINDQTRFKYETQL